MTPADYGLEALERMKQDSCLHDETRLTFNCLTCVASFLACAYLDGQESKSDTNQAIALASAVNAATEQERARIRAIIETKVLEDHMEYESVLKAIDDAT